MRLLITGANGFLGKNLKNFFQTKTGFYVETYQRNSSYKELLGSNLKFDAIINCASATPVNCPEDLILESNVILSSKLSQLANHLNIKYFVNISSIAIYGIPKELTIQENSNFNIPDIYGVSKLVAEKIYNSCIKSDTKIYHFRTPGIVGNGSYLASKNIISTIANKFQNNISLSLHSPEWLFNNIISDKTIFKSILKIMESDINTGVYLMASKESIKFKELIIYLKDSFNSNSNVSWKNEPPNHISFSLDIKKAIKN